MKNALISFSVKTKQGIESILKTVEEIGPDPIIESSSMVYKRDDPSHRIEIAADCVFKIKTSLRIEKLNAYLKNLESFCQSQSLQEVHFKILAYEQEVHLIPDLNVPWPSLFEDFLILKCATEVWPDYVHPILKRTLLQLLSEKSAKPDFEFLRQGPKSGLSI